MAISARKCGADIVKFQLYDTSELIIQNTPLANYQKKFTKFKNQYEMLKKFELSFLDAKKLIIFCKEKNIKLMFSIFNESYAKIFNDKYLSFIKVPSGEINNYFLLNSLSKINKSKKIIISTGMASDKEIKNSLKYFSKFKKKNLNLLHCISNYPTKIENINLSSIKYLKNKYRIDVGLSDHTQDVYIPSFAVFAGANIIEKHFTLDRNMTGPDQKSSLNPIQFKKMVIKIREAETILGLNKKKINKEEKMNSKLVGKYIVAKKSIKKGDLFSFKNLTAKRSGYGLSIKNLDKILYKKSKKNYTKNQIIKNNA